MQGNRIRMKGKRYVYRFSPEPIGSWNLPSEVEVRFDAMIARTCLVGCGESHWADHGFLDNWIKLARERDALQIQQAR